MYGDNTVCNAKVLCYKMYGYMYIWRIMHYVMILLMITVRIMVIMIFSLIKIVNRMYLFVSPRGLKRVTYVELASFTVQNEKNLVHLFNNVVRETSCLIVYCTCIFDHYLMYKRYKHDGDKLFNQSNKRERYTRLNATTLQFNKGPTWSWSSR